MKRDIDFSDNDSPEEHEYKKRAQKADSKRMLQKLEVEKEADNEDDGFLITLVPGFFVVFVILLMATTLAFLGLTITFIIWGTILLFLIFWLIIDGIKYYRMSKHKDDE